VKVGKNTEYGPRWGGVTRWKEVRLVMESHKMEWLIFRLTWIAKSGLIITRQKTFFIEKKKGEMKKLLLVIPLVILLCFIFSCQVKKAKVERFMEDGVEVVLNFAISQNKSVNPVLNQILSIDTENEDLVEFGLNDIYGFDVSSSGDIFIFKPPRSQGNFILKFNRNGEFIKSFGNRGQGPSEIQFPIYQKINLHDEVSLLDAGNQKLLVFDGNGGIIHESKPGLQITGGGLLLPLTNGNYLYRELEVDPSSDSFGVVLFLIDSKFEEMAELGRTSIVNPRRVNQFSYPYPVITWGLSNKYIFVGVEERRYDIHVYDFEGQLIRRIRNEYTPVPFSEESREQVMKDWQGFESYRKKIVMPEFNPPFQHLFADDLGRLYVVTFEPGNNQGEYMTDVFDTEGVFYSRLSLRLYLPGGIFQGENPWDSWVTVKNDILYCIQEKVSGHKELVAYKIMWE